ncbi:MAG: glycosyltransferase [Candidatus Rokubacteria bacterium]|nr:glycosyltransferase [Candidatus Rokubacteria bacterium]
MSAPIRVARVIARLNIGGPAQHVVNLTAGLPRDRFESVLLTGRESATEGSMADLAAAAGVTPVMVPGLGRALSPRNDLASLIFLFRYFRRFQPHLVHTHTAKAGTVGRIAAWMARVPVIVHTYHGHVFHGYFSPAATRVFLGIERALARVTDRLLTVSQSVHDELRRYRIGRPGQAAVLPLGLDLARFLEAERRRGELRAELGLAPATPLVGIVARLVPIKRHEDFLESARLVSARVPGCVFLVVGDGERRNELEAIARARGLGERVRFLGWRRDLDRIYADLDVVALMSANEGSPVSLIEAMAAARAVVATRVGGVPDLVEDGMTGLLVPPANPVIAADAIVALLAEPERRAAMGAAGRKRASPAFSVERLVSDVDRLYTELVAAAAPRSRR